MICEENTRLEWIWKGKGEMTMKNEEYERRNWREKKKMDDILQIVS